MTFTLLGALLVSCLSDDSGTGDGAVDASLEVLEDWEADPTSVHFDSVDEGALDFRTVVFTNRSSAPQEVRDIALVEAAIEVRFAGTFVASLGRPNRWLDLDGNGHDFEVRETAFSVPAGGSFDVLLQYQPLGEDDNCRDPDPAPCGFLSLSGPQQTVSVAVFVPR